MSACYSKQPYTCPRSSISRNSCVSSSSGGGSTTDGGPAGLIVGIVVGIILVCVCIAAIANKNRTHTTTYTSDNYYEPTSTHYGGHGYGHHEQVVIHNGPTHHGGHGHHEQVVVHNGPRY